MKFPLIDDITMDVASKYGMDGNEEGLDGKDWFFCTRKHNKDEVLSKVLNKK